MHLNSNIFELEIEEKKFWKRKTSQNPKPGPSQPSTGPPHSPLHFPATAQHPLLRPTLRSPRRFLPARPASAAPRPARARTLPSGPKLSAPRARRAPAPSRCAPGPLVKVAFLLPHPRVLNGNRRDLRRGSAKHAPPRIPAGPYLAPHDSPAPLPIQQSAAVNPSHRPTPLYLAAPLLRRGPAMPRPPSPGQPLQ